tara:strand:+ start:238 stop:528 length:291 start_codon:yes stop_codon:yes gene_type:complete
MSWFIVVYFLVNGSWIEADLLEKEGWSPIVQTSYKVCINKINESNKRFENIAIAKNSQLDIKFTCECRKNYQNPNKINCKERNWIQKILDKFNFIT